MPMTSYLCARTQRGRSPKWKLEFLESAERARARGRHRVGERSRDKKPTPGAPTILVLNIHTLKKEGESVALLLWCCVNADPKNACERVRERARDGAFLPHKGSPEKVHG